MKYLYYISGFVILIIISSCSGSRYYQGNPDGYTQDYDQQQMITYQQFYNDLSPYGDWINYDNYGYVWVPYQTNFRPYTNGYWVYTDYGWTWVSNYNWGWAPFHYGRWINDVGFGWMWVPGYEWAPAWVVWRGGGDYYGWAPLAPGMDINIGIGAIPYNDWTFVPRHYINSRRINNYYLNPSRNNIIINNTTIINNTNIINNQNDRTRRANYNPGPPVREVEETTGTRIRRYNLVNTNKPEGTQISNSSVRVFRPTVQQQPATSNPRPEKVKNLDEIRATRTAPVRQFPKDQTPQVLKDEAPVRNNRPGLTPERNNTEPSRVFPKTNENRPEGNRSVAPIQQNRNNPPANNRPQENKVPNNPPVRTFPNNPTAPVNEKPVEQQIRKSAPSNNQPQVNQHQDNTPVRTFTNPNPGVKQNEYKVNENKINSRPASTPEQMRKINEQQSTPAPQATPQRNSPTPQPVRRVIPRAVPSLETQRLQKNEKHDESVRTFNPQKK
jgi:hypothetical protein